MYTAMATNGYIFSDSKLCSKFVDAGLQFVQISIDSMRPEVHDRFRGVNGSWERACKAVKNFSEYDIFVEVATTVTSENCMHLSGMAEFFHELGADWFMLYNFIPAGRGNENRQLDISLKRGTGSSVTPTTVTSVEKSKSFQQRHSSHQSQQI